MYKRLSNHPLRGLTHQNFQLNYDLFYQNGHRGVRIVNIKNIFTPYHDVKSIG